MNNGKKTKPKAPIELDDVNFSMDGDIYDKDKADLKKHKKTISNTI
jgi:hypothetical protein